MGARSGVEQQAFHIFLRGIQSKSKAAANKEKTARLREAIEASHAHARDDRTSADGAARAARAAVGSAMSPTTRPLAMGLEAGQGRAEGRR